MIRKLLITLSLLFIVGCVSAPKNFHSLYYFNSIDAWTEDKIMIFVKRNWWDCSEIAYFAYHQLSTKYNSRIVLGRVSLCREKDGACTIPMNHVWVEYLKDGKIKIFDMLKKRPFTIARMSMLSGKLAYNFVRTEQFLRSLGYEAFVGNVFFIEINNYKICVMYRYPNADTWVMYSGEFDSLRTEEYKRVK